MTNFTYNDGVPATNNNPSVDQPDMLTNTHSLSDIWDIDHIGFNANDGGTHLQTSFKTFSAPVVLSGDPASVVYPAAGVASTGTAQLYYKNSISTVQLSCVRAWAFCSGAGTITASQSVNIASIARRVGNPAGAYTVTLTANSVSSANFSVLVTSNPTLVIALVGIYRITSATTFDLFFIRTSNNQLEDPVSFSFEVKQI